MTIDKLAEGINQDCDNYKYFYAYRLVKETIKLWDDNHIDLLCSDAQKMVAQVRRFSDDTLKRL